MSSINYHLIRYADRSRTVEIYPKDDARAPQIKDFVTIAAHEYHGPYYPGTHYHADHATRCRVSLGDNDLLFELEMEEPELKSIAKTLTKCKDLSFFESDFVCLNMIAGDATLTQIGVKMNGDVIALKNRTIVQWNGSAAVNHEKKKWQAVVMVPLAFVSFTKKSLAQNPLPLDVVRFHQYSGAVTAWCPIPDQLPFNELYEMPVFCFGLAATQAPKWPQYVKGQADTGTVDYTGARQVKSGAYRGYDFTYRVGDHGLALGGALKFCLSNEVIECNYRSPARRRFPEKDWSEPQWTHPEKEGYLEWRCSNNEAVFAFQKAGHFSTCLVLKSGGPLNAGDTVTVSIGQKGTGHRAQLLSQHHFPFKWYTDLIGNGIFLAQKKFPLIRVTGRAAQHIELHAQPTPAPGQKFRLLLVATDYVGNIADGYRGTVRLTSQVHLTGLPETYSFKGKDQGVAELTVSTGDKTDFVIQAVDTKNPDVNGTSNLIVTSGVFGDKPIFFGDVHTHSQLSDGRLALADKFREVGLHRGCDFWVSTDHGHDITQRRKSLLNKIMDQCNRDGFFTALPGYEWTGSMGLRGSVRKKFGHRNVIFKDRADAICDAVLSRSDTPKKLKKCLAASGAEHVIVNHFHCGDPKFFPGVDDNYEISGWCGNWVRDGRPPMAARPETDINDFYKKGIPVGTFAGTDHGTEAYYTGLSAELTGLYADDLTREGIFRALKNGTGFATSGNRTLIYFTVNGREPSNSAAPVKAKIRKLKVVVGSHLPIVTVEIIKNGAFWKASGGRRHSGVLELDFEDSENKASRGYYYVRVQTAQGHMAWSSAVFYSVK